jgi:multidrug efflux pump subunit AcrA (membrane-fusion protein)
VKILVETRPQVLLVPIEAVIKEEGKSKVKLVKAGEGGKKSTDKVDVKVGKSNDREIEITEGVKEGDEVVIDPASSKDNEAKL